MSLPGNVTPTYAVDYGLLYTLKRERDDRQRNEIAVHNQIMARLRWVASARCESKDPTCSKCVALSNDWYMGRGEPVDVIAAQELNTLWLKHEREMRLSRFEIERKIKAVVEQSAFQTFVKGTRGFGAVSCGSILGEAGDLRNYGNPGKLWKRMGLAVVDGKAHRKVRGENTQFPARRRELMFRTGDALIKQGAKYRQVYLDRKALELEQNPTLTPQHAHRRAQRYMEKRLLRDLWSFARHGEDAVEVVESLDAIG